MDDKVRNFVQLLCGLKQNVYSDMPEKAATSEFEPHRDVHTL